MKASDERGPQYLRARPASKSARPIVAEALARHAGPGEFTLVAARALGRTDGQCWRSRHLAVVIRDAHDCAAAARALLALVRASARTHLVLDLRRARPARETRAAWRWPAFAVLFDRCLGHGDLERAEAVASAACCLSALRGVPLSSGWRLRIATLRFWEGRYEEADRIVGRVGGRTRGPAGLAWIALGGLVAWMTGNLRALSRAAHRLDRRRLRRRDAAIWRDGFRLRRRRGPRWP